MRKYRFGEADFRKGNPPWVWRFPAGRPCWLILRLGVGGMMAEPGLTGDVGRPHLVASVTFPSFHSSQGTSHRHSASTELSTTLAVLHFYSFCLLFCLKQSFPLTHTRTINVSLFTKLVPTVGYLRCYFFFL